MSRSPHPATLTIDALLADCSIKRTRASGPGGQHRNKVETAIVITHTPTGIVGQASENRSQNKNRESAIVRLRINLALAIRSEIRPDSTPSERWHSRIRSNRISVNLKHEDYPALLAEAIDAVVGSELDVSMAAGKLSISSSQLVKFLKTTPACFEMVNRQRHAAGLKRLR